MLQAGETIGRYIVEAELGRGGMGAVYQVRHVTLGSKYALKVLHVSNPNLIQRLIQEGQVQARLQHPHILAVHDVLDINGHPGLLLDYVRGSSLDTYLAGKQLPETEAVPLLLSIVRAVGVAHAAGVIHRDLKPANVLLDDSVRPPIPKVADFGLARLLEGDDTSDRTRTGVAMGTLVYMPPEQIRDAKRADARADVYALAVMLYEMVTGERPIDGNDLLDVLQAKLAADYSPPESLVPSLSLAVRTAIRFGLSPDRNQRIPDCDTFAEVLTGQLSGDELARRLSVMPQEAAPRGPKRPRSDATMDYSGSSLADDMETSGGSTSGSAPASLRPAVTAVRSAAPATVSSLPLQTLSPPQSQPQTSMLPPSPVSESAPQARTNWTPVLVAALPGVVAIASLAYMFVSAGAGEEAATTTSQGSAEAPTPTTVVEPTAPDATTSADAPATTTAAAPAAPDPSPSTPAANVTPAAPVHPKVTATAATGTAGAASTTSTKSVQSSVSSSAGKTAAAVPAAALTAPSTADAATTPTPSLGTGRIQVKGEFESALVENAAGERQRPGSLVPGQYTVYVKFRADGPSVPAASLYLGANQTISLVCNANFERCSKE